MLGVGAKRLDYERGLGFDDIALALDLQLRQAPRCRIGGSLDNRAPDACGSDYMPNALRLRGVRRNSRSSVLLCARVIQDTCNARVRRLSRLAVVPSTRARGSVSLGADAVIRDSVHMSYYGGDSRMHRLGESIALQTSHGCAEASTPVGDARECRQRSLSRARVRNPPTVPPRYSRTGVLARSPL